MAALSTRYPTAFITGASGGLGHAFTRALLDEGIRVWGTARDAARLSDLAVTPSFVPVALDLGRSAEAEAVFRRAADEAGGAFDLVINNAGYGLFAGFTDAEFSAWQMQWEVLYASAARLSHAALRGMRDRQRGCLVNVSSLAVDFPLPFMSGYNAAKAALSALTESLMFELAGTGVTVIDFRPGDYRTAFNQAMQSLSAAERPEPRLAAAWAGLERNLAVSPLPAAAARDLLRALRRGASGTVCSGSVFQATLAPFFARFAPRALRRGLAARYFGAS